MKKLCQITPFYIIWKWNIPLSTALVKQNPEWKCCFPGNVLARRVKNSKTAAALKIQSNCTISSSGNLQELQCKLNFIVCDDKMLIFSHMETRGYYKDCLAIRALQCHIATTIKWFRINSSENCKIEVLRIWDNPNYSTIPWSHLPCHVCGDTCREFKNVLCACLRFARAERASGPNQETWFNILKFKDSRRTRKGGLFRRWKESDLNSHQLKWEHRAT